MLTDAFEKLGLEYTWPEGAYFVLLVCLQSTDHTRRSFTLCLCLYQNISRVRWPEDYPFPPTMEGRGRDFKLGNFSLFICYSYVLTIVGTGLHGSSQTRLGSRLSPSVRCVLLLAAV